MDQQLVARLLEVNRAFYARFAGDFAETRSTPWPGMERAAAHVPRGASVLDVGCGNGRLGAFLIEQASIERYVGVDGSAAMVRAATERLAGYTEQVRAALHVLDVSLPGWTAALGVQRFDSVFLVAILQHIPSADLRLSVLQAAASLAKPAAVIVLCNWQLNDKQWLERRQVEWAAVGIDEGALGPNDYLLDWRRGGLGYRYCHRVDAAEASALAWEAGLRVRDSYLADGTTGDQNHYLILTTGAGVPCAESAAQ